MKKSSKETSRDFSIRLKKANSELDPPIAAPELKCTFIKGHRSNQRRRL